MLINMTKLFRKNSKYLLTNDAKMHIIYLENFLNSFSSKSGARLLSVKNNRKGSGTMAFAETFKALSDPVRREILVMLKDGKMTAGDIAAKFDLTSATVSYHLSVLKKADLLFETKVKNYIYYEVNISVFEEIMLWFSQFGGNENEKNK